MLIINSRFLLAEIYINLLRDKTTKNEIEKALEEFQIKIKAEMKITETRRWQIHMNKQWNELIAKGRD